MKSLRHYHRKWRIWRNKIQLLKKMTPLMLAVFLSKNVNGQDTLNNAAFRINKAAFNPEIVSTNLHTWRNRLKLVDFDNDGDLDIIGRGERHAYDKDNIDLSLFYIENKGTKNIPYFEVRVNEIGYGFENSNPIFLNSNLEKIKEIKSYKTNESQTEEENLWNFNNFSKYFKSDFLFKDINGDEKIDLITLNADRQNYEYIDYTALFYENIGSSNSPIFDTVPFLQKSRSISDDSIWNSGIIPQLMITDIDQDGTDEIILGSDHEYNYDDRFHRLRIHFIENNGTKTGNKLEFDTIKSENNKGIFRPNFFKFNDLNGDNKIDISIAFLKFIPFGESTFCKSYINEDGNFQNDTIYDYEFFKFIEDNDPFTYDGKMLIDFVSDDIDNDGDLDILVLNEINIGYCYRGCYYNPIFSFFENNGKIGLGSGKVSYDLDNDGIASLAEQQIVENLSLNTKITTENNVQFANPFYNIFLDLGINTITPSLENFTFAPTHYLIDFDGNAPLKIDTFNYVATFDTSKIDFAIDIANTSAFRPGFSAYQNIAISGFCPSPKSGIITYHLDENLILLNANPPFTSELDGNYTWQIDSIGRKINNISLSLQVKSSTPIGTNINCHCQLEIFDFVEKNLENNIDSVSQVVRGSFDPNDKTCNLYPTIEPSDKPFEYTIRFQNTGTDTAFNIVVLDTISTNFDISTFQILQSSHPYKVEFDKNRTLKFYFYDILLPDSSTNEPASHGFIKYSIQPKQGAGIGTTFINKADIYFDFNTPITTNETRNIFGVINGINHHQHQQDIASKAYPNPTREKLLIEFNNPEKQATIITIYDINGKQLLQKTIEDNFFSFNTEAFSNGVYLYTIESILGFGKGKFIKE